MAAAVGARPLRGPPRPLHGFVRSVVLRDFTSGLGVSGSGLGSWDSRQLPRRWFLQAAERAPGPRYVSSVLTCCWCTQQSGADEEAMQDSGGQAAGGGDSAPHVQPPTTGAAQVCPCPALEPLSAVRLPTSIGAPAIRPVGFADRSIYVRGSNSELLGTMISHQPIDRVSVEISFETRCVVRLVLLYIALAPSMRDPNVHQRDAWCFRELVSSSPLTGMPRY